MPWSRMYYYDTRDCITTGSAGEIIIGREG